MEKAINISGIIIGKWNKNKYRILRKIGIGGIAEVFLVECVKDKKLYAMKISKDILSLNREYQLLKKFAPVEWVVNVYEMDDFQGDYDLHHFILLEYIKGEDLKNYIEKRTLKTTTILGIVLIILKALDIFHESNYILGDLKLENIMFDQGTKQIKLIDLGGVVEKGGTIKEYTPAYDRATWRCGVRRAEESYDLFTLTMILVRLLLGEGLNPQKQNKDEIIRRIGMLNINDRLKNMTIEMIKNQRYCRNEFALEINELYNIEKISSLKDKKRSVNQIINNIFFISLGLLILTSYLLLSIK